MHYFILRRFINKKISSIIFVVPFLLLGSVSKTNAQNIIAKDSVLLAAEANCSQNIFHRILLGKHYRPLWKTPVTVRKLDLENSGYKIIREGGSRETFNLRLTDSLGRQFVARSVKKDLTKALPADKQKSFIGKLFRDLMFANHPYGPLIVPPLAKAAGILHCTPSLFVIYPDKNVDNQFKNDSASLMVLLEERPDASWVDDARFNYSSKVVGSEEFLKDILDHNNTNVDAELFLRNRLLDIFIGDWSRHEDQYRWVVKDTNKIKFYQPVPRDRDHAFYKFNDGLINKISLLMIPKTVTFTKKVKHIDHLYIVGSVLGKIILPEIEKERWNNIVNEIKLNLTDEVIEKAVARLPVEIHNKTGAKFIRDLKSRRNQLTRTGNKFYKLIFTKPNVVGTNEEEIFIVSRSENNTRVQVFSKLSSDLTGHMLSDRIFYNNETKSISIFGLEGNDVINITGNPKGIKLEIHPGPGEDSVNVDPGKGKHIQVHDKDEFNFTQIFLKQHMQ